MTLVRACGIDDLHAGGLKQVRLHDRTVCLACTETGDVYAISDVCTHEQGSLSEGRLIGTEVECSVHGSRFDVASGAVTSLPAEESIDTFPVVVQGDDVLVDI
jgi:3-phenylpropionate/trans-cinnamate dioxygenase ferredoxin subunit